MKRQALLVIGEEQITKTRPYVSFRRFIRHARRLNAQGRFELQIIEYNQLLSGQVPPIQSSLVKVVFFFPYQYWNRHIEVYRDGRIYGERRFGQMFRAYFERVERAIERYYRGKKIVYINSPRSCYLDRDKKACKDMFAKSALPVPRTLRARTFSDIQKLTKRGVNLYIKPRFGAMGKGITYVDKQNVVSNFLSRKGQVVSRPSDFNWPFKRVKEKCRFLNELLKKGFICEEAINSAVFKGQRFDLRIYVVFGQVVYMYAKSSPQQFYVTNWSQGGKIDKGKTILRALPPEKINQVKRLAKTAAKAAGLNFAGIDIIFSQDLKNAYVLEANAFPGYEKGFDLMQCLVNSLVK